MWQYNDGMQFPLVNRWTRCHWSTRLCVIGVVAAILIWQARWTWLVHSPMFGWPMPFDNLWYSGHKAERSALVLVLDAIVWLALAGSTAFVLERWRRGGRKLSLRTLFIAQAAAALVLILGLAENYLRQHPNNESIVPRYAMRSCFGLDVWFDIGLFSDSFNQWTLIRGVMIFAIWCAAYSAIALCWKPFSGGKSCDLIGDITSDGAPRREPRFVRIIELFALAVFVLLTLFWLTGPKVR
jgi:hypothetical protein